jgi:hypothetical protein
VAKISEWVPKKISEDVFRPAPGSAAVFETTSFRLETLKSNLTYMRKFLAYLSYKCLFYEGLKLLFSARSPPTSNGKVAMKPGDGVSIRVPTPIFEEEESTRQRTTPTHQRKSLESFKRGGVEQSGAAAGSARRMRDGIRLVEGRLSPYSFCFSLVSA